MGIAVVTNDNTKKFISELKQNIKRTAIEIGMTITNKVIMNQQTNIYAHPILEKYRNKQGKAHYKRTGTLKRSTYFKVGNSKGKTLIKVIANTEYASALEFRSGERGHTKVVNFDKSKSALSNRPYAYMLPAIYSTEQEVDKIIRRNLK